jgi:hypothetical protein
VTCTGRSGPSQMHEASETRRMSARRELRMMTLIG